ncbi:hypothetical protein B5P53_22405, partial [Citrobacter portucalensis]
FKSNEYANLVGGERYEPHEENPMLGFRGAGRYALIRPTKLQTRYKACKPDKALAPHSATVVPDGATLIRPTKLQNMHKACRPDKALAPHPATVVPDGATLICANETTEYA